jgi:hypothetical protein
MTTTHSILTATGRDFPLSGLPTVMPDAEPQIEDIAHALAQINRYTGHAARPYSVAEHSLLVCEIVEREFGMNLHVQLLALMHDAHEAYCGDINTPSKDQIGPGWRAWESRWEHLVHSCFALLTANSVWHRDVKRADLIALATEKRDLMPDSPRPWPVLAGVEPVGWINLRSIERERMTWEDWRDRWLDRYHELDFARNELKVPLA